MWKQQNWTKTHYVHTNESFIIRKWKKARGSRENKTDDLAPILRSFLKLVRMDCKHIILKSTRNLKYESKSGERKQRERTKVAAILRTGVLSCILFGRIWLKTIFVALPHIYWFNVVCVCQTKMSVSQTNYFNCDLIIRPATACSTELNCYKKCDPCYNCASSAFLMWYILRYIWLYGN